MIPIMFKQGDRVECVDIPEGCRTLVVGKVYTVRFPPQDKGGFLYLEEERVGGWYPYRFKFCGHTIVRGKCKRMFRLRENEGSWEEVGGET